ncbi:hypothetical protein KPL26_02975 [Clostridium algidicarnis]|uniref:hypothetical protein n=1 Tax=Clostridium algidicarnis TaxID=37659 RepID=UPI001C0C5172|nr:hypothetical protein [Clostridium algidicarnis]MBU3195627.1 hypothetical protein [Clostridium algidicarnis]
MNNKELIKQMVKLQVLCVRWVERNSNLQCKTFGDMDRILKNGKLTITYKDAAANLKKNIEKHCKSEYLLNSVLELETAMSKSEIADLRFGFEPQRKFTELERELDTEVLKRLMYMTGEMVGIKYIEEHLNIAETTVKQACQQERLLNTTKIGKSWMVHIPECRDYWGIENTDESSLYKDWEY